MTDFFQKLDCEKKIYMRIISFAMVLHIIYVFLFASFSIRILTIYNIFSVLFYVSLIFVIYREHYKIAVAAVHAEVALFVATSAFFRGMNFGMGMYLLSMASTVYFCPFKHKFIPYILAICDALVYVVLRISFNLFIPAVDIGLSTGLSTFFHVFNAVGSFMIILTASFFTDASAGVTQKKLIKEKEELASIANYDHLTGLQSRHLFKDRIKTLPDDDDITIVIGDMDDFKDVNDTYGHICGDYVIQTTAEIMRKSLDPEKTDICRWGGEEFVFLFRGNSVENVYENIEALRKKIEQYKFHWEKHTFNITMTFGLIPAGDEKMSLDMLRKADTLLYKGKKNGKNVVITK